MAESHSKTSASVHKTTFAVCDIPVAEDLLPDTEAAYVLFRRLQGYTNASSVRNKRFVKVEHDHAFARMVHYAYSYHYPLILSPDHIWLLICQGFAQHVHANAESLRHRFVDHEGKELLEIERREFRREASQNEWDNVFLEFAEKIQGSLTGDFHDLLIPQFSTTGTTEKAAFQISFMDTFKDYYEYTVMSLCGISSVTLEGTPADWRSIVERVQRLSAYDLEWWVAPLLPILEEFVRASEGAPNVDFWAKIYREDEGSGGPTITGWILRFFPYFLLDNVPKLRNVIPPDAAVETTKPVRIFRMHNLGTGLSLAPFKWRFPDRTFDMQFVAGFLGITQDHDTKALRPEIGWAVCEAKP